MGILLTTVGLLYCAAPAITLAVCYPSKESIIFTVCLLLAGVISAVLGAVGGR